MTAAKQQPNTRPLDLETLTKAVADAAAFRCRTELQPAGGEGDKVFPPTYAGAVYATEKRRLPGREEPVECVLLDSVQSQANRMEEALQQAIDEGRLQIPLIEVDFTGNGLLNEVGKVTSLQAPHRIADAILRDSLLDGTPFRHSELGRQLDTVSLANATALYELCPTALVLGMWDSTGPKGGLGVKFQRAMVSEIVGIDAVYGVKTSSRIDPLQIEAKATIYQRDISDGGLDWSPNGNDPSVVRDKKGNPVLYNRSGSAQGKPGNPSKANHSNVTPSLSKFDKEDGRYLAGGVTVASAEQMLVLSLPALRRLQFPLDGGKPDQKVNEAGRTVLAALSLCAATLAAERGFDLRSRCLLWPTEAMTWGLLGQPGSEPESVALDADAAIALLNTAVERAEAVGLKWRKKPLELKPSPQLVQLVKKSQELAAAQGTNDEKGGE